MKFFHERDYRAITEDFVTNKKSKFEFQDIEKKNRRRTVYIGTELLETPENR